MVEATPTLSELRKKGNPFKDFFRAHCGWLFDIHSLFYFALFVFGLGFLWAGYSLLTNSFTQLYNWDYNSQYVTFTYDFYDTWHRFFSTGVFELYSTNTYLGSDNIGSNAYYGLFDPFLFVCYIFPRSWIPQTFAVANYVKCMVAALTMRLYLRYMGVSEGSSRLGGVVYAYSGFVNYFVGFPSFVSIIFAVPLILMGIEKTIKEKKISSLVWGLFFLGMISFFFLVVVCIWGVIYAIWRYFWTIKSRNWKDNLFVLGAGVFAFALGLMLCSWTLLPSIRESSLSGRTSSVGAAYLASLTTALKTFDSGTVWARMFELVGDNQGRELMGLISFFYPTCNYLYLPLAKSGYDAWTSSLFCYTPMTILFLTAVVSAIRKKHFQPLIATALCCYLLFTTFAYYFFYAFAGDGYGRWFIVLIPEIIFFATQELDHLKEEPKWVLPTGTILCLALTGLTVLICYYTLTGKSFSNAWDPYWQSSYSVPAYDYDNDKIIHSTLWLIVYQLALVVIEGIVIYWKQGKDYLWKILVGFASLEIIVAGNTSFAYGGIWKYETTYLGGANNAKQCNEVFSQLASYDGAYYRVQSDAYPLSNAEMAFGFNGTANFHSLFNYDVAALSRYSHSISAEWSYERYGKEITKKNWAAYYGNKRYGYDTALGTKYYVVRKEHYPSAVGEYVNVPFDAKLAFENSEFSVYENPLIEKMALGHAVDKVYPEGLVSETSNNSNFYNSGSAYLEILRNEDVYLDGAIIEDKDVERMEKIISLSDVPLTNIASTRYQEVSLSAKSITTVNNKAVYDSANNKTDNYEYTYYYTHQDFVNSKITYESPSYFLSQLNNPNVIATDSDTGKFLINDVSFTGSSLGVSLKGDYEKLVFYPTGSFGGYLNDDPSGAYFVMSCPTVKSSSYRTPRVYFVGDTFENDGVTLKESNVVLSYEWHALNNWKDEKNDDSGNLFGFYCNGRAKYVVYCDKTWGGWELVSSTKPTLYKAEKSQILAENDKLASSDYCLSNVHYSTDHFTFTSAFTEPRLVVTSLGYDAGWSVKAETKDANGNSITTYPEMFKLDGGFVGFYAPQGEVSYVMTYVTPRLKTGLLLALVGTLCYLAYEGTFFYLDLRKEKKKELALRTTPKTNAPSEKPTSPGP